MGQSADDQRPPAKIHIRLPDEPGIPAHESLWAESMGTSLYRLCNIPCVAYGYAYGDIVRCIEREGRLNVVALVRHGGNLTLRLYFAAGSRDSDIRPVLDRLVSMGCGYERGTAHLVAIDVPFAATISLSQIAEYLNSLPDDLLEAWEFGKHPGDERKEWGGIVAHWEKGES